MLVSVPWPPVSPLRERGGCGDWWRGGSVSPELLCWAFQQGSLGFSQGVHGPGRKSLAKSAQSWGKWRNAEVCGLGV